MRTKRRMEIIIVHAKYKIILKYLIGIEVNNHFSPLKFSVSHYIESRCDDRWIYWTHCWLLLLLLFSFIISSGFYQPQRRRVFFFSSLHFIPFVLSFAVCHSLFIENYFPLISNLIILFGTFLFSQTNTQRNRKKGNREL